MLKCQFHSHAKGDLVDNIKYSPKELIDKASKKNFDVLAITSHRIVIFSEELREYAEKKSIILLPGIEFEINKKHILGINIDKEIEKITNFNTLTNYKKTHPDCLIIAPHPFFPGGYSLGKELEKHIELFDAVEISFAYTKSINFNKKAIKIAEKYNKPLIATADSHFLNDIENGYTHLNCEKNTKKIIDTIKKGKLKNTTSPTSYKKIFTNLIKSFIQNNLQKK